MNLRKDLETQIAKRLETISADDMQRLAEDYARIRFPERFPRFDSRALSSEGKSRAGWPDAYIVLSDGTIDGVEATTSKGKGKVLAHLDEDVTKARDRTPKLSGFVFVSGQPMVQPDADELAKLRQRFVDEAGLELERVNLVFGKQLVQELAYPELARARVEILGISDRPVWFEPVRSKLPPDSNLGDFIPSSVDYESGRVYRPLDADRILGHLVNERRALVRGVGASGKTVLAWLLALETTREGWPAYYLDLARLTGQSVEGDNGLQADLIRFSHPHVLFILDNIHLDERMAKGLALAWEELPLSQRPRLLFVGRELHTHRGSPVADLNIPTVPLKARQAEVRGVYRRLASRGNCASEICDPPSEWLDRWVQTFGGDPASPETTTDLIAFSAAVLKRLPGLAKGVWNLTEQDAIDEIREAYLKRLSEGERHNLMRLAVLSEFEFSLPELALVDKKRAGFEIANRQMGLVFLERVGAMGQHVRYRLAHAALGRLLLAAAYESVDINNELRAIAIAHPYTGFNIAGALAAANQFSLAKEILLALMENPGRLLDLPGLSSMLNALRLVQKHEAGSLIHIGPMLVNTENRSRLIECALLTPLQNLQTFLAYAEKTGALKTVFDVLAEALGSEEVRSRLIERAQLTPLDHLQTFLAYAEKTGALKTVFDTLMGELIKEENRSQLVKRFIAAPLDQAVSVLSADAAKGLWQAVIADIDQGEWERSRLRDSETKVDAFVRFQQLVITKGRPDLVLAPALALVRIAEPKQWQPPNGHLGHLSSVLRCATNATDEEVRHFLRRVATSEWVDHQVDKGAKTGGLAGCLLSLSSTLHPELRTPFLRASLCRRILAEITTNTATGVNAWVEALSLLGAAAALGLRLDSVQTNWPGKVKFNAILESRLPDPGLTTIGHLQVQFWLGLREMCRLRNDGVSVSAKHGDKILVLWRAAHEATVDRNIPAHVRELNAGMISWLECCRRAGWKLIRNSIS